VFSSASQAAFRLAPTEINVVTNGSVALPSLRVRPPDLTDLSYFWKAWPGLQAILEGQSAVLRLRKDKKILNITTGKFTNAEASISLDQTAFLSELSPMNSAEEFEAIIVISSASSTPMLVPAGKVTVKGIGKP
jgi:hypothetical protein